MASSPSGGVSTKFAKIGKKRGQRKHAGEISVAEIIDLQHYRDTGEAISPTMVEKRLIASLPDLDVISSLMEMSTDELITELHIRIKRGHSFRNIPTDVLITELVTRMSMIDLICLKAAQMENNIE